MFAIPWFDPPGDLFDRESGEIATCDDPLTFASNDETQSMVMCCCNAP